MTVRIALALALAALAAAARAGDVVGTVTFQGAPPPLPPAPVTKDGATCGASQPDESLRVSPAGRVALAVVEVEGAPRPPPVQAALGQERCRFAPHVQAVPAGSTLGVANGDPILHSVRGWTGRRSRFELALASRGDRAETALERPGVIQVRCDVHAWMIAYVVVTSGPAAVSGEDGTFAVRGVPPGEYTVRAWHERLGERTLRVTVPAEGAARADFSYGR